MDTWGSWTFSDENKHLLADVLDKFKTDQCSLDGPRKVFLSSLTSSSKARDEISSSSSDDSDVEKDFNAAVQTSKTCFPKSCSLGSDKREQITVDEPGVSLPDTFDSETYSQSQRPGKNRGNATKPIIVELLNAGDCDAQELRSWLIAEEKNGKDVSEIIGEVWPEMVTNEARHGLCEALVKIEMKPQVIFERIYLPWFKTDESNLTGFIESLSKLIVHFPEYACKSFLVELLKDKESTLVKHVDWLSEIMRSLERQHWCTLLSEYMQRCDGLDQYQIPVMMHFLKNCNRGLSNEAAERLVVLCRNAVHEHSANRDFAMFLVCVIEVIDLSKFRQEIDTVCGQLKGASKFLIKKALKDAK